MKKLILVCFLLVGVNQMSFGQLQGGIKAGINYNSDSFQDVKNDVFSGAKSKTGYHVGVWLRGKLPLIGLYIRPELVYTQLKNEVVYTPEGESNSSKTTYDFKKIDLPILLGTKIFGIGNIFAGPSFQYILKSDFDFNDLKELNSDGFSLGLQFGAGIEFGKVGLDLRWERALSDTETKFVDNNTQGNVNFDTRVNQIILGLSLKF
ncbi:porin family protein [Tenacibaculum sp. UWU-22]|uniref:porin family protein n=1 Tax=Tenacibaculum sp. UWU-22 TaxID=3234187 RepID=UPI0034DB3A01